MERFSLARYGDKLWTREVGAAARADLDARLDALDERELLVVDLTGVLVFDFSFANEFFGKTLLSLEARDATPHLVVDGLTEYTRVNLDQALNSLGLQMATRSGDAARLIGRVHASDAQTFHAVVAHSAPISAAELADELRVTIQAINERLGKLVRFGILRRTTSVSAAGREQFLYSAPVAQLLPTPA